MPGHRRVAGAIPGRGRGRAERQREQHHAAVLFQLGRTVTSDALLSRRSALARRCASSGRWPHAAGAGAVLVGAVAGGIAGLKWLTKTVISRRSVVDFGLRRTTNCVWRKRV